MSIPRPNRLEVWERINSEVPGLLARRVNCDRWFKKLKEGILAHTITNFSFFNSNKKSKKERKKERKQSAKMENSFSSIRFCFMFFIYVVDFFLFFPPYRIYFVSCHFFVFPVCFNCLASEEKKKDKNCMEMYYS